MRARDLAAAATFNFPVSFHTQCLRTLALHSGQWLSPQELHSDLCLNKTAREFRPAWTIVFCAHTLCHNLFLCNHNHINPAVFYYNSFHYIMPQALTICYIVSLSYFNDFSFHWMYILFLDVYIAPPKFSLLVLSNKYLEHNIIILRSCHLYGTLVLSCLGETCNYIYNS